MPEQPQPSQGVDPQPGPGPRRRRRAVGPPGAVPASSPGKRAGWPGERASWPAERAEWPGEPGPDREPSPADDDERLLADVPPHHGGP